MGASVASVDSASRKIEIFLAEDNPADVYLIRQALEEKHLDHRLHVSEDGEEAANYLSRIGLDRPCPDIILLDLSLPKQDGQEVLQQFRAHLHCGMTPVIVMSSSDSPKDHALIESLGATFFKKPADLEQFWRIADLIVSKLPPST
ncbi:MAG: response regulator [Bryobacteraceae bacterium]